ncbi:MAG: hypothetical protein KA978_12645 [Deltaproteobacteria bacterium]|nr:hypothetical protein [Deltaproteobacteria bacterium]
MSKRVAMGLCLLGASGCSVVPLEVVDAGSMSLLVDVATDRDPARDVPAPRDAGTPRDVAVPIDVPVPTDVPVTRDVPVAIDVPSPIDVPVTRDVPAAPVDAGCLPEPVYPDRMGEPRNAAGQIRYCWPGEALCFCDRDNDCYAQAGYVSRCPSTPTDAGSRPDVPATDTGSGSSGDPVVYGGTFPSGAGRRTVTLQINGNPRRVVLYVPSAPAPSPALMLLFHGTNGTGDDLLDETDAQAVANANGAILAAPFSRHRSTGDWDHRTEDTYWETWPNVDATANEDLLLTRAIIAEARRVYGVDAGRVYALGHSNGAFFAATVASVLADRIAAFASSSGGLNRCANTWSCSFMGSGSTCAALRGRPGWCSCSGPEKPVSIRTDGRMPPGYLTHGTGDDAVTVQYTCELEARMQAVGAMTQTVLRDGDGHDMPRSFVSSAWRFLSTFRR